MSPWLRHPLGTAAGIGLLGGLTSAFFLVSDASEAEGWPVERAEVIAIDDTGGLDGLISGCGKHAGPARDVTLRSPEPPPGLDDVFVMEDQCYGDDISVGEVWSVSRVVDEDGDVTIYENPQSVTSAQGTSVLVGCASFVVAALGLYVRRWSGPRRYRSPLPSQG